MEANVTMQQNHDSMQTESDQVMEDISKHESEHVINKELSLVQENSTPTKKISNSLPIHIKPIQLI